MAMVAAESTAQAVLAALLTALSGKALWCDSLLERSQSRRQGQSNPKDKGLALGSAAD